MDEVVDAIRARFGPTTIIHWEDVSSANSYRLLQRLRARGERRHACKVVRSRQCHSCERVRACSDVEVKRIMSSGVCAKGEGMQ
eukprot:360103-Chlamydomonas_euryale.AAC.5